MNHTSKIIALCRMLLWQWLACCFFILLLPGLGHAVDVTLDTGNSTHRVPIELPLGPAGHTPSLALVYAGHEGNGWMGSGWSLEGISYIDFEGPEARGDGLLTPQYRLVLGGRSYRLINTGVDPSNAKDSNYWRTEDEAFLRIQKVTNFGETWWVITDRNGTKYEFGLNHSNATPSVLGKFGGAWGRMYLTSIIDQHGNSIHYSYDWHPVDAQTFISDAYIQSISYPGGNVKFNWQDRTDNYALGVPTPDLSTSGMNTGITVTRRLASIEVGLDASKLIRRYELGYTDSPATTLRHTQVSLLTKLTVIGADWNPVNQQGTKLPPTTFTYKQPTTAPIMVMTGLANDPAEALAPASAGGGICVRMIDWNRDGRPDVVMGDSSGYKVYLRDAGFSFQNSVTITAPDGNPWPLCSMDEATVFYTWGSPHIGQLNSANSHVQEFNNINDYGMSAVVFSPVHNTALVDIDGDGLPDLLHNTGKGPFGATPGVSGTWHWRKNHGNNTFGLQQNIVNPPPLGWLDDRNIQLADMNGDGLLDFVWFSQIYTGGPPEQLRYHLNWWANVGPTAGGNIEFRRPTSFTPCGLPRPTSGCQDLAVLAVPFTIWGYKTQLADMNGDGYLDFVHATGYPDGTTTIGIPGWRYLPSAVDGGTGQIYFRPAVVMANPSLPEYRVANDTYLVDVNGDGLPDVLRGVDGQSPVYQANSGGLALGSSITLNGAPNIYGRDLRKNVSLADMNNDGFIDIMRGNAGDYTYWPIDHSGNYRLLEEVRHSFGGTESITYQRRALSPGAKWIVSQITTDNGLGSGSSINYSYSGPQSKGWPWNEFRGFAQAIATYPTNHLNKSQRTVTHFHQDNIFKGRIDLVEVKDNDGSLFATTDYTYLNNSSLSGVTRVDLTSQVVTTLDGSGPGKFVRTDFANYDNYGQAGQVTSSGTGVATRVTTTTFVYNTTDYIVSKPYHTRTTLNGIQINESWFNYDGQANGVAPTKGDLTLEKRWLSFGGTSPETQYFYDNVGRRTGTIDAKGNTCDTTLRTTKFEYNTTSFFTLPVKETNARCQDIGKTYWGVNNFTVISGAYAVPGFLATVTDPNGVTTTSYVDALSRPMATVTPPDNTSFLTTRWTYSFTLDAEGRAVAPSKTQVQKREKAGNAGTLDSFTYVDGFGRTIQTKTEAETPGQWITQDTVYNARGLVESISIPYLTSTGDRTSADPAQPKTTKLYDVMKRPIKITNPDGTFKAIAYDRWVITETDEKSFATVRTYDALGRLLSVQEPSEGGLTLYSYDHFDANGNEGRRITDAQQNKTTERYDSLGRKIALSDPDLGSCGDLTILSPTSSSFPWYQTPCWNYFYDANGNLLKQMDGQGTVLEFSYDKLNRIETKSFTDLGLPSAPSGLTATTISASRIDLSWSAASDNIGVKEYRVERCNNRPGTPACSNFVQITSVVTTSFSNATGLTDGMVYTYRIRAMDTSGNLGGYSSTATATTPDITPPTPPTGLTATAFASNRIDLSWTASTDNVGVTAYQVQRCQGTGCTPTLIATVTGTSYNDTQRTASTTYTYRVRATDAAGNFSGFSSSVNRATPAASADATLPTTPTTLTATAVSPTQVNLTWTASTDNLLLSYYEVERSSNNGPYTVLSAPVATNFTDNTVTAGITYLYRVRAVDGANNKSNYSTKDLATTILFSEDPLVTPPGSTSIKAIHVTQLRQAVNSVRAAAGLAAATWTDATLTGIVVKAVHVQELRNNLNQALTTLGLPAPTYTDPTLTSLVTAVKAAHVGEPRLGVK